MRALILAPLVVGLVACGSAPGAPPAWLGATDHAKKEFASGTALERYFPLVDGMIYHYVTENEVGEQGLLVARAGRTSEAGGQLRFPTGSKRFEYVADGITVLAEGSPAYVLKLPLTAGATWRGEHGGTTKILSVAASADVPSGHFDGCVQTLEERLGDHPVKYATTFCPGVGVILLEAASGASLERAALKSYAVPLEIGPDGTDRFQAKPPAGSPAPR